MLAGHGAAVAHELRGPAKARDLPKFGHDRGRRHLRDPAQGLQRLDHDPHRRGRHLHRLVQGGLDARPDTIAAVKETATNPSVCTSFALAMVGADQGPAYPGIPNHEPDVERGRKAADNVRRAVAELRVVAAGNGAYVSESNFFDADFQRSYWGDNYRRLAQIKQEHDPEGLFFVHNGVGSEQWSADGFTRRL